MAGKIYYFAPGEFDIKRGNKVIVETARGVEIGTAVSDIREISEEEIVSPLKTVIRIADEKDIETEKNNRIREKEAFKICAEKIRKHELEMKLIDAEYTFDSNKLLFYFTADGRIDFRELVKDLAGVFRTRIELRQIGVRDETKILGGYGICGRPLCCHCYLADFQPVSIKMAKEQNLSLNPTKISGMCGRLMCCLQNEEETYEELNASLPSIGDTVTDKEGISGEVMSINVLRQKVKVLIEQGDEKEVREYEVKDLEFVPHHKKGSSNWAKEKQRREKDRREREEERLAQFSKEDVEEITEEEIEISLEEVSEEREFKKEKRQNRNNKRPERNQDKDRDRNQNRSFDKKNGDKKFEKKPRKNFDKNRRPDRERPEVDRTEGNNNFNANFRERNHKGRRDNQRQNKTDTNDNDKKD